jgi:hypothetical protein
MDFLFVSLLKWAKGQGYESFDLGLSSLAGVGEHSDDPAVERVLHFIYEHINQFYNFKGLQRVKDKFSPQWSPRYIVVPSMASLPTILGSLLRADSGDGSLEAYDRKKVVLFCLRMGVSKGDAAVIADRVEGRLYDEIPTKNILQMAEKTRELSGGGCLD